MNTYGPRQNFTGAHDAVARNVELGNADVGGLSLPIFESLVARGTVDPEKVIVIGYSADIPQYPWVLRTDMVETLEEGIKNAFLSLEAGTEAGDAVLTPFKADGFVAITDADYDIIREIRKSLQTD